MRALAYRLGDLGKGLSEKPMTLAPTHESSAEFLPLHITTHPFRQQLDMAEWPDAREIVQALGDLHRANARVLALKAWMLPEDRAAADA